MYKERFWNIDEAIAREKQIKGWSRNKKQALSNGDYEMLSFQARSTLFKQDFAAFAFRKHVALRSAQDDMDDLPGAEPAT